MSIDGIRHMTFDEVDLWCLYLDAVEEAQYIVSKRPAREPE